MNDTATDINALLMAPPGPQSAGRILDWYQNLRHAIDRGDFMIGLRAIDEVEQVPEALRRAAAAEPGAWLKLAEWLQAPEVGEPDLEGAASALAAAQQAGLRGAGRALAKFRWFKQRETSSPEAQREAYEIVREEVEKDPQDAEAFHLLGLMTCAGFGVPADPRAAFELQKQAAEKGSADADFELYIHLSQGLGVEVDESAAFEHVRRAAEANHPRAQYNMGSMYALGSYVPEDMEEAARWYDRACENFNGRACATVAAMYFRGEGLPRDPAKAAEYFDLAEEAGFDPSAIQEVIGFEPDAEEDWIEGTWTEDEDLNDEQQ
jgi:hypothetical protein